MISGCIMNHNSSSSTGLRKSIEQLTTWTVHGREAEIARQRPSSHLKRHCVVCSRWPGGLMPENRDWTMAAFLNYYFIKPWLKNKPWQPPNLRSWTRRKHDNGRAIFPVEDSFRIHQIIRERFMIFRGIGEDDQKFQNVYCSNEVSGFSKKCSLLFNLGSSKCCHVQNHIALQVPKSIVISQLKIMTK